MKTPFQQSHELVCDAGQSGSSTGHLPGYPAISLADEEGLAEFLAQEFVSVLQDRMAPRLWWMSKQDSGSISPLHRQAVKRRTIVVTEDPKLHLVWIRDRIFIKPLPAYLANHSFWENQLGRRACSPPPAAAAAAATKPGMTTTTTQQTADPPPPSLQHIRRAALGYLRTYTHLVRHESDMRVAMDPRLQLLPEGTTWPAFCRFAADVRAAVSDADVSERYRYGEIRLTRLNLYARLLVGLHTRYQTVEPQYSEYFARIYGPMLFCIGMLSLVLSSLQIVVGAADAVLTADGATRPGVMAVAFWFAVFACLLFCAVGLGIAAVFVYKVAREWEYALKDRKRRLLHEGQRGVMGRAV